MSVNVIRFESETDYSSSELETLKKAFTEFITELDEDANPKSIDIQSMTEEKAKAETASTVREFLMSSSISGLIEISHPDHENFEIALSEEGE